MKRSVLQRALPLFLTLCLLIPLPSCAASEGILSKLGFDTHNYRGEKTIAVHEPDSETALLLCTLVRRLSVNSPFLVPFSGAKEAASVCRDAILNHMLEESYARYAGNTALLTKAAKEYPQMQIQVLIPANDFEAIVYASFGGKEKISNKSGSIFRYLDKIDAYTSAAGPQPSSVITTVLSCEETEKTYRLTFRNTLDEVVSPTYFALIIKRDDGSLYIRELSEKSK